MKQIAIVNARKVKHTFIEEGIGEYRKRLSRFVTFEIIEPHKDISQSLPPKTIKTKEGDFLLGSLKSKDFIVCLDQFGKIKTSEQFSVLINERHSDQLSRLVFLIGGPLGLDERCFTLCHLKMSLSSMTFTHEMARLLLVEQLFRAYAQKEGLPYHR